MKKEDTENRMVELLWYRSKEKGQTLSIYYNNQKRSFITILRIEIPQSMVEGLIGRKMSEIIELNASESLFGWHDSEVFKIKYINSSMGIVHQNEKLKKYGRIVFSSRC